MVVCASPVLAQSNQALRDSLAHATDILAYHPDSIDLRLKKAAWNIQLEQWNYAKDDLDKVLYLNSTNIAGLFYRAFVNEKLNRYNFARLDYQNLLVLVPGNFQAQLGLALLNQKDLHFTEAYDGINNLIEQYPDSAIAYAARGGMERKRGSWSWRSMIMRRLLLGIAPIRIILSIMLTCSLSWGGNRKHTLIWSVF